MFQQRFESSVTIIKDAGKEVEVIAEDTIAIDYIIHIGFVPPRRAILPLGHGESWLLEDFRNKVI